MSDDEEILMPKERIIEVDGEEITVKKLSIGHITDKMPEETLARMASGQTSTAEDLLALVEVLDEDHLAWLLSVLSGKTKAWVIEHFDLTWAIDLIVITNEVQNLGELWGKVMTLRKAFQTESKK